LSTEAQKAASRAWYQANKGRAQAVRKAWYEANKAAHLERNKAWKAANPERCKEHPSRRKYAEYRNAEVQRAWRERNAEHLRAWFRERYRTDPKYKAKRRRARCKWADAGKVRAFYIEAAMVSMQTGVLHDVDHIVPLKHPLVCGLHNEFNLQVLPASENRRKRNRFEIV
jgi:hypothetical protein